MVSTGRSYIKRAPGKLWTLTTAAGIPVADFRWSPGVRSPALTHIFLVASQNGWYWVVWITASRPSARTLTFVNALSLLTWTISTVRIDFLPVTGSVTR